MMAVVTRLKMRYVLNLVRSAMAPEAIVTAAAANTAWKKKSVEPDRPPEMSNRSTRHRANEPQPKALLPSPP